jgi:hypothetical protein
MVFFSVHHIKIGWGQGRVGAGSTLKIWDLHQTGSIVNIAAKGESQKVKASSLGHSRAHFD